MNDQTLPQPKSTPGEPAPAPQSPAAKVAPAKAAVVARQPVVRQTGVSKPAVGQPKGKSIAKAPAPAPATATAVPKAAASKPAAVVKQPGARKATAPKAVAAPAAPAVKKKPALKSEKPKATSTKTAKPKKIKMVRDSFTFPETEHAQLVELKKRVIGLGQDVKKGELIRIGIGMLSALADKPLLEVVARVEKLKTGRPKQ